jgi:ligand-binding sensor domain-containing protein/signal transduction histidine kinase/DNA-binding response OmpR family regulator
MKSPYYKYHLALLILIGIPGLVKAQLFGLPNQERYSINSGLSHNSIMDIHQDHYGFLWISTADGLNRYDGNSFLSYLPDLEDSTAISDSFIPSIELDENNKFWIATQKGGLNYYNYEQDAFITVSDTTQTTNQTDFFVTNAQSIYFENDNITWMGTSHGIVRIPHGNNQEKISFLLPDRAVYCFLRDQNNTLWIGTSKGIMSSTDQGESFQEVPEFNFERSGLVIALLEDKKGNIIVGAKNGLFLKTATGWKEIYTIKNGRQVSFKNVNAFAQDHHNRIWVGGQEGLSIIDDDDYTESSAAQILRDNNLGKENIHTLFIDKEKNLWIGTANNGLIRLFLSDRHFPVFRQTLKPNEGGTPENTIRSIWADDDSSIWLGSYGAGLFRFDRNSMQFTNYRSDPSNPFSISGNQVSCIFRDHQDKLWVGTWGDGLNEVQIVNGKLNFISNPLLETPEIDQSRIAEIHQIFEDEYDNLWVVTNGGLAKKKKDEKAFSHTNDYFNLPYFSVNSLMEDQAGNWWMGTWNGLFIFNKDQVTAAKEGKVSLNAEPTASFYYDKKQANGLSNNRITCLHQDSKGRIWIATYGGGLNLWTPNAETPENISTGSFRSYTQKDGLPNNVIYGILEDDNGRLWLSTNNGLVLFTPDEQIIQTFTTENGIQSNQFYFGAYTKTPHGELIFGGNNGFNIFEPLLFSSQTETPPQVLLNEFLIRGEQVPIGSRNNEAPVLNASILSSDTIFLQPQDNYFRLEFASPTLNNARKLKYAYRLVGFSDNWHYTDAQNRFAVYSNLFEGDYTFEVKASLDGKTWNTPRKLGIIIAPPWYRTWWAYLLFGLGFVALLAAISRLSYVYSTLRNKLQLERLHLQQEKEVNEMRLWFFTYISHEFRTPLTLIISPISELLKDRQVPIKIKEKLRLTYRNSNRLLKLVNQILNFRMINSGKVQIKAQPGNIVAFSSEVFSSFSDYAQERKIAYRFKASNNKIQLYFDPEKIELVLYNLLSNAFKYSEDGANIELEIRELAKEVNIIIKDSGLGIKKEKLQEIFDPFQRGDNQQIGGSGIGLALVKSFVEVHQGQIEVNSQEGQGSSFILKFKKGKKHFNADQITENPVEVSSEQIAQLPGIQSPVAASETVVFPEIVNKYKPKLLIVEDEVDIRNYFAQRLKADFKIWQAANGQSGFELALKHSPDIIISDVMMPVLDGLSMVKKLKAEAKTNHIPIILLTARAATEHQVEGFERGAIEYLTKPINVSVLKAKIFAILNNIDRLKAHYKHEGILTLDPHKNTNEEKFLLNAAQIVEENFSTPNFNAQLFAQKMGVSRSGLYKKLNALTGKSTTEFIRFIRLKHAEKILREGQYNISQTAFQTGFNDLKYFRKCFKQEFGLTPSEYKKAI